MIQDEIDISKIYTRDYAHVYLYAEISNRSVLDVKRQLELVGNTFVSSLETQTGVYNYYSKPNPIVLHLNSPGGDVNAGIALTTVICNAVVPVIVVVEGVSASAATFVTVTSPYKYCLPYSTMLIHQYFGAVSGKHHALEFEMEAGQKLMEMFHRVYKRHTHMPETAISKILRHDLILPAKKIHKYGMIDRIIQPHHDYSTYFKGNPRYDVNAENYYTSPYVKNIVYFYRDFFDVEQVDSFARPLDLVKIVHQTFQTEGKCYPLFLRLGDDSSTDYFSNIIEIIPVINAILISKVPVFVIVDGPLRNYSILLAAVAYKTLIMKKAFMTIDWTSQKMEALKFDDLVRNTKVERQIIKEILRKYTAMPKEMLDNLFKKRYYLSSADCVKYKIAEGVIKCGRELYKPDRSGKRVKVTEI